MACNKFPNVISHNIWIYNDFVTIHPTAQKLIDSALRMLETNSLEQIGIEKVLDDTKVARSSLYHHFENFPHLLECAVAHRFARETEQTIDQLKSVVETATNQESFKVSVLNINRTLQAADRLPIRMQRIVAFSTTDKNARFMEMLKAAQQKLTDAYATILKDAQLRGWIRADINAQAVAVFVQAMTIGRIVDDVSEKHVEPESWIEVSEKALISLLW